MFSGALKRLRAPEQRKTPISERQIAHCRDRTKRQIGANLVSNNPTHVYLRLKLLPGMEGSLNFVLEAQGLLPQVVKGVLHLFRFGLEARGPRQALYELEQFFAVTAAHLAGLAFKQDMRHGTQRGVAPQRRGTTQEGELNTVHIPIMWKKHIRCNSRTTDGPKVNRHNVSTRFGGIRLSV